MKILKFTTILILLFSSVACGKVGPLRLSNKDQVAYKKIIED